MDVHDFLLLLWRYFTGRVTGQDTREGSKGGKTDCGESNSPRHSKEVVFCRRFKHCDNGKDSQMVNSSVYWYTDQRSISQLLGS